MYNAKEYEVALVIDSSGEVVIGTGATLGVP